MPHGINITNKKATKGRNKVPHIARKLSMPMENPDNMDSIDWGNYDKKERSYKVKINGKTVYSPPEKEKKSNAKLATNIHFGAYKDDVKKGKWV